MTRGGLLGTPFGLQWDGAPEFSGPSVTYFVTGTGANPTTTVVYTDASGKTTVVTVNEAPTPSSATTTTTTTTTSTTTSQQTTTSSVLYQIETYFAHQCGATLVTGLTLIATVVLALATLESFQLVAASLGSSSGITLALLALTLGGASATIDMVKYDYQNGPNATPQGAFEQGASFWVTILDWLASVVP